MKSQALAWKRRNKWLLPLIAGIMVVFALIVVYFIPQDTNEGSSTTFSLIHSIPAIHFIKPGGNAP